VNSDAAKEAVRELGRQRGAGVAHTTVKHDTAANFQAVMSRSPEFQSAFERDCPRAVLDDLGISLVLARQVYLWGFVDAACSTQKRGR